jgi:hypothetical protein
MTKTESAIVKEAASLFKHENLLRSPIELLTDAETLYAWSCLDLIEKKLLTVRKAELRDHLLSLADKYGDTTPEGHRNYQPEGSDGNIQKQCRKGKVEINFEKLLETLNARGFDTSKLYKPVLDEEKIEAYIALGEISPNELRECTSIGDPTYALIIKKPSEVEELLPKVKKALKK